MRVRVDQPGQNREMRQIDDGRVFGCMRLDNGGWTDFLNAVVDNQ